MTPTARTADYISSLTQSFDRPTLLSSVTSKTNSTDGGYISSLIQSFDSRQPAQLRDDMTTTVTDNDSSSSTTQSLTARQLRSSVTPLTTTATGRI
jgi:hypothetical protein